MKKMRKAYFWEEVCGDITEVVVPAKCVATNLTPEQVLLCIDAHLAEMSDGEDDDGEDDDGEDDQPSNRQFAVCKNGTCLLAGRVGRDKRYVIAWHQTDSALAKQTADHYGLTQVTVRAEAAGRTNELGINFDDGLDKELRSMKWK
jgi:hypothetical protein